MKGWETDRVIAMVSIGIVLILSQRISGWVRCRTSPVVYLAYQLVPALVVLAGVVLLMARA